jgi:hypothetical protein
VGLKALAIAVGIVAMMSTGASAAAASPAGAASWRPGSVGSAGETTAVTGVRAGGTTTEFAFVYDYSQHWMFVRVNGGTWKLGKGPGLAKGEMVVGAQALSASRLMVFTTLADHTSRILADNGGKWTLVVKFPSPIGSMSVLSPVNIWVFGSPRHYTTGGIGVWRYNGTEWRSLGVGKSGGAAVSATSAWAHTGTVVDHLTGGKWTMHSLASLIPQGSVGVRSLIGVYPASATTAYAVGSGGADGPLVVFHYDGHRWTRVASYPSGIVPFATDVASDGKGGLLMGGTTAAGGDAMLLHYVKGSGKIVAEPVAGMTSVPHSGFLSVAKVPGTDINILGGQVPAAGTLTLTKPTVFTSN